VNLLAWQESSNLGTAMVIKYKIFG